MATLSVKLRGGGEIPAIGFGTGTAWYDTAGNDPSRPRNQELISSIKSALAHGYRHLDAAEVYGTELEVGIAIKESGVSREQLFVTTKVDTKEAGSMQDPEKALKKCLSRLQLNYVDLFLIHSPFFSKKSHGIDHKEAWQAMERIHDQGLAKHIGLSNYRVQDLTELLSYARIRPAVNQIEFNPYLQSPELTDLLEKEGILVEAYAPLAPIVHKSGGPLDPVLEELGKKYSKTPGQVLLRWTLLEGHVAITTSGKPDRQKEQLAIDDFELTADEVQRIKVEGSKLHFRQFWKPQFGE